MKNNFTWGINFYKGDDKRLHWFIIARIYGDVTWADNTKEIVPLADFKEFDINKAVENPLDLRPDYIVEHIPEETKKDLFDDIYNSVKLCNEKKLLKGKPIVSLLIPDEIKEKPAKKIIIKNGGSKTGV